MLEYYFCDRCKMACHSSECPNCFIQTRRLNISEDCIECGHKLGECTCNGEPNDDV